MSAKTDDVRNSIFNAQHFDIIDKIKLVNDRVKIIIKNFGNRALNKLLIKGASSFLKTNGATTAVWKIIIPEIIPDIKNWIFIFYLFF